MSSSVERGSGKRMSWLETCPRSVSRMSRTSCSATGISWMNLILLSACRGARTIAVQPASTAVSLAVCTMSSGSSWAAKGVRASCSRCSGLSAPGSIRLSTKTR
ncbi:hypothetical protein D3C87_1872330 [compost metagenome]